ncbi:MAG: acetylglutamate kinase [Gemmatimonadetes bacterium]|nr:acetylglutamate kinase [Gemmatimonadota bacterium]
MRPRVVKVGGSVLGDAAWLASFAAHVAAVRGPVVVVHGGGPEISELSSRLGVTVTWVDGRRVTPPEAMDVTAMVLSGRINKRVVAALLSAGVDAIGLSGEDGGLLLARPRENGALGRVGELVSVRASLLESLLAAGHTPVVSPVSRGVDGAPLNVNADEAATAVAAALGASELLYLTDVPGVLAGGVVLPGLSAAAAEGMVASGAASGGMAVKLEAALAALGGGVPCVRIGTLELLTNPDAGTAVRAAEEAFA